MLDYDRAIPEIAREDARTKRLMHLRDTGPTTASALLASIGAGHYFTNGRQVNAWIGLTPGQYSSGGKARLGIITNAGDAYLRGLLVNGTCAVLARIGEKQVASAGVSEPWSSAAATGELPSRLPPQSTRDWRGAR